MRLPLLAFTLVAAAACSGGGSGSSNTATSPSSGSPPPSNVTLTITTSGISPKTVTIATGGQVTFVNNDTKSHNMQSDPHPEHDDCPEFGQVGFLTPGQSRTTGNLNTTRTCGFHDHDDFANTRVQGSVIIQ